MDKTISRVVLPDETAGSLADHENQVRRDLQLLRVPPQNWTATTSGPDGKSMPDVVVIGAGMYGIAAAAALVLKGIRHIKMLDRAPAGQEGPWVTYARMPTLRSPKELPGPSLGIPSLTFRAWYEAKYGAAAWDTLYKVPNAVWQDYLQWLKVILDLPVENDCPVADLRANPDFVEVKIADGRSIYTKRVIVATGRAATGGVNMPAGVSPDLWPDLAAHTCETIDFAALAGRTVAVIGAGPSAWDNAATALETGAARVVMYARRKALPQVNKGRAITYPGILEGWFTLTAAQRWEMAVYLDDLQAPPPHETVLRTMRHDRFELRLGTPVRSAVRKGGKVELDLASGPEAADFLIVGTGFRVDLSQEPLFAGFHQRIARWQDRFTPPDGQERPHLGLHPWLGEGFELQEREPDANSSLQRIHLFNSASYMSFGSLSSDVPSLSMAAERLSSRVAQHVFRQDFPRLREWLGAWQDEHELDGTPLYAPDYINRTDRNG